MIEVLTWIRIGETPECNYETFDSYFDARYVITEDLKWQFTTEVEVIWEGGETIIYKTHQGFQEWEANHYLNTMGI